MQEIELKLLWQTAHEKLEQSAAIQKKHTESITKLEIKNFLSTIKPSKILAIFIGIAWVIGMGALVVSLSVQASGKANLFFLVSMGLQVLITAVAIIMYLYQLVLIYEADLSKPVFEIQKRLSQLQASTLDVARILFLQLPLWTTFYLSEEMFVQENAFWLVFQVVATGAFTWLAIWLFKNIKYENRHQKWFQFIFQGKEWQPVVDAMELLEEMDVSGLKETGEKNHLAGN